MRPWKPRVRQYQFEVTTMGGQLRRLGDHERWFVERTWFRPQRAKRFPSWEQAMAYADSLPAIAHFLGEP